MKISTLAFCLSGLSLAAAHSWIEQMQVIAPNGTFTGAVGFPRGNVLRTTPGFGDPAMVNLLPPNGRAPHVILESDLMCKASQTIGNQTPGSPALSASPGDMVALRYQENGHVTIPGAQAGKPANRGTVFIYGTSKPSNSDTFLSIHNVWTSDGTGGDGRGVLLATRNFDDGQCYQVNSSPISQQRQKQFAHTPGPVMGGDLWCQSDVTLPGDLPSSGSYTLYWVWDWPTAASAGNPTGTPEVYTTCMDINLVPGTGTSKSLKFASGQDLNSAAIESELSTALVVKPTPTGATGAKVPAVTAQPATTATTAAVSVPSPAGNNASGNSGPQTVTVTEQAPAIFVTVTVTGGSAAAASPSSPASVSANPAAAGAQASGSSLSIRPFVTDAPGSKPNAAAPSDSSSSKKQFVSTTYVEETVTVRVTAEPSATKAAETPAEGMGNGVFTATPLPKMRGRAWRS
jgi:hypothetical protein